jgi:DNA invertase Pin-like site-specific DNA recombinase
MSGQHVGYIRVSTVDQNTVRQLEGIQLDQVFTDKLSGKDTKRPMLQACIAYVRSGDTLHVHSIDRLARNAKDLLNLVEQLMAKDVTVRFEKNNLAFSADTRDHMARLQLTMLAAFAEFERELIKERQREGIELAKKLGKYKKAKKATDELITQAKVRCATGEPLSMVAKHLGLSRETLYRHGVRSTLSFSKK